MGIRVLGYIRVSTDKQADEGYSLEAQRQDIERYCELYNLELIDIIADEGESAGTLERPGIERALGILKSEVAEGLVVAKLDRLTRNVKDLGYLLEEYFSKYALMSVSDKIDTSTASGRLVLNIIISVAQWEREAISERIKKAMDIKRGNRERIGNIPYGKRLTSDGIHLEDNPQEQEIISMIKSLRSDGITYETIEHTLKLNRRNREGNPFTISAIHRIANL